MEYSSDRIRLVILKGSVRPGNYTSMAAALVEDELKKHPRASVETIEPAELDLPLPGTAPRSSKVEQLHRKVASAAGAVLATPEYNGSYSSVMKLLIENLGHPSPLFGKPVAFAGVEAADALLSNSQRACGSFGYPRVPAQCLVEWIADWVRRGGADLGKPTHFESRDGQF